jgi:hypothetical protein
MYLELLDREVEGELAAGERRHLAEHLAGCAGCRGEQQRLLRLHEALGEARIPLAEGFRARVMEALPVAPWERPAVAAPHRAMAAAVALLAAFAVASALLLAAASGAAAGAPGMGVLAAVGKMATAALVTGAGLLGASWSGIGMAVGELFASAPAVLVGFVVLLVLMSLLLVSLLRRPRTAHQAARSDPRRRD